MGAWDAREQTADKDARHDPQAQYTPTPAGCCLLLACGLLGMKNETAEKVHGEEMDGWSMHKCAANLNKL